MAKKSLIDQETAFFSSVNLAATATTVLSNGGSTATTNSTTAPTGSAAPSGLGLQPGNHVQGEVLVKFGTGLSEGDRAKGLEKAAMAVGGQVTEVVHGANSADPFEATVARVTLGKGIGVEQAIAVLSKLPGVEVAEPNWVYTTQAISNDSYYTNGSLWGMYGDTSNLGALTNSFGSQANEAWKAELTGSMKTVVGVIDTGIDYTHPDLYLNVWLNQKEIKNLSFRSQIVDTDNDGLITFRDLNNIANTGNTSLKNQLTDWNGNGRIDAGDLLDNRSGWEDNIDYDKNGYVDDLIGWDFVNNDNDPMDDNGHGSHVSGTIGGLGGNGTGVVGVNWNVQIMGLKFLNASGSGSTTGAISAMNYYTAAASKAAVGENYVATNNSWGGGGYSSTLFDAIVNGAKQDLLFVAAAGNSGTNNDATASYPANYDTRLGGVNYDSVISVAAIQSDGKLASYSQYGATTVDIGAPGSGIFSSVPGGYASYSGTSMATPHVTGAIALLASANPNLTAIDLKGLLLSTAAATPSLSGKTLSGGRLDIGAMILPLSAPTGTWGTIGNDTVSGTTGNDVIAGVLSSGSAALSVGSIDRLVGNGGNDIFILGDARGRFYDDGNSKTTGTNDYGYIADFVKGDKIQLKAGGNYFLVNVNYGGGISGTGIFHDSNGNKVYNSTSDELIGIVGGVSTSTLASSDFMYV